MKIIPVNIRFQAAGLLLLFLLPLLAACDHIAAGDELIEETAPLPPDEEKETSTLRNVLLEDFTGQMCVNCPKGTDVIEQLHEVYGDRLIAVGIHGGPLGFKGNAKMMGLATQLGDTYYNYWKLEYQPVGLVNRGGAVNYTDWTNAVMQALATDSGTKMELTATLDGSEISIGVSATRLQGDYTGKLQVWVLEDSIVATQKMPDGSTNRDYVHNHVLRTAVNGDWGEPVTLTEGQQFSQSLTQAVDAAWNTAQLSVVAFLYNDSGVEQAGKVSLRGVKS